MKYAKPALSYDEQAANIVKCGLEADKAELIECLERVSYYRLSGYLRPFQNSEGKYLPGTTLKTVWRRYTFDRMLRLMLLDAIERVEVTIRTRLVYHHSHAYGPFGYTDPANLPKLSGDRFGNFLARLYDETERSREPFVEHFTSKYGDNHSYLPLWMAAEIMSFGGMLTLFDGIEPRLKRDIAAEFGLPDAVLHSWLKSLNVIRNICAHHSRVWNRELGFKPILPNARKYPEWHSPVEITNNRVFGILTILQYMLGYAAPQSHWPNRLNELLGRYPDVPIAEMGFPGNWNDCPIWKQSAL